MSENLNEPQSRTEEILQNALGEEYDVTPQSRVEVLLEKVVEGGGSGSGTSLITNTYRVENVTIKANKSATAQFSFSSPIVLSKIRAMWIRTDSGVVGNLVSLDGNGNDIYLISYNLAFLPVEADTRIQTTINPILYITTEE